jgi:hypothetical protein
MKYYVIFLQILPRLPGMKINEFFDLVRPLIEFRFDHVLARSNNIFEVSAPLDLHNAYNCVDFISTSDSTMSGKDDNT